MRTSDVNRMIKLAEEKIFIDAEAFAQELKKEAAIEYIMEFYGIDRYACMELYMDEVKAYMELNNEVQS